MILIGLEKLNYTKGILFIQFYCKTLISNYCKLNLKQHETTGLQNHIIILPL